MEQDQQFQGFECSLCLDLLNEPVTTFCGHTFCRCCLADSLKIYKKQCPKCRETCHINPQTIGQTVVISNYIQTHYPQQNILRQQQTDQIKKTWVNELPIFFYNNVLFPQSILHLHLFEDRYKQMIKRVIDSQRQFFYLPAFQNYKAKIGNIGIVMHIDECQFLHDGRAKIKCSSMHRGIIRKNWVEDGTQGLAYCQYEQFDDEPEQELTEWKIKQRDDCQMYMKEIYNNPLFQDFLNYKPPQPPINKIDQWSFWVVSLVFDLINNQAWGIDMFELTDTFKRIEQCNVILIQIYETIQKKKQQDQQINQDEEFQLNSDQLSQNQGSNDQLSQNQGSYDLSSLNQGSNDQLSQNQGSLSQNLGSLSQNQGNYDQNYQHFQNHQQNQAIILEQMNQDIIQQENQSQNFIIQENQIINQPQFPQQQSQQDQNQDQNQQH